MNTFFRFAAAGLAFFAGVQASTEADASTCRVVNFNDEGAYILSLNNVLSVVPALLPSFVADPTVLSNQTLDVMSFSALGYSFEITPTINYANISGISGLSPRPINVTSADSVDIGVDFTSTLTATATLTLNIQQVNHKWYQLCLTSLLHPNTCPPKSVGMNLNFGLVKPSLEVNAVADLAGCPAGSTAATCSDVAVGDILVALLSGTYEAILNRVLLRFKDASLSSLALSFDSISSLSFSFTDSGSLIDALEAWLLTFSKNAINKKGGVYKTVIDVTGKILKKVVNNLIGSELASKFGSTCYDA